MSWNTVIQSLNTISLSTDSDVCQLHNAVLPLLNEIADLYGFNHELRIAKISKSTAEAQRQRREDLFVSFELLCAPPRLCGGFFHSL
jgi:hypothetical protein